MTTNKKKSQNCSGCRATSAYLEKELKKSLLLHRDKLTQHNNLEKSRWNGFSKKLFEN